jgi:hypothetical protein
MDQTVAKADCMSMPAAGRSAGWRAVVVALGVVGCFTDRRSVCDVPERSTRCRGETAYRIADMKTGDTVQDASRQLAWTQRDCMPDGLAHAHAYQTNKEPILNPHLIFGRG